MITNFSVSSSNSYLDTLKMSAKNLINLFKCLPPGIRLIYLGSSAQYGKVLPEKQPVSEQTEFNPVSNYGVLKAFEEIQIKQLSEKFNIGTIIARIFNITGPNEPERMVGGAFVSQLIKGNTLEVGNLFPKRDFLDIRDTVDALKVLGIKGKSGNIYNICSGKSISIEDYLNLIIKNIKCSPQIKESSDRINKTEIDDLVGDNYKLKQLGWKANYPLDQTVKDLIKSYRN
jgi:GDP-4-dehydro-6-deoxy-D-mannose reductase